MAEKLKVLLLIPHLGGGGAEQVTALLARGLSRHKYELHLGLVTERNSVRETFPPWVQVHLLGARRVRFGAFRLLRLVREVEPDLILSGMAHLNFLVLLLRPFFPPRTRVIVRQNSTVSSALARSGPPWYTYFLYRRLYRLADRIICQSRDMADDLTNVLGTPREQIAVLPNPVDFAGIRDVIGNPAGDSVLWQGPGPHLLAVGRLAHEKGFDLLIVAIPMVRRRFPHADLIIAGSGAEESALKTQAASLGLESAVRFAGHVRRPYIYFPGASLFVLSSRYEGMPNALLEAAEGGLPLVATPASGGVVDLLRGRHGAWVAPEVSAEALGSALLAALGALKPGQRFPVPASPTRVAEKRLPGSPD
jgi:glycosyltransferase involved in cell wall biosynthesis